MSRETSAREWFDSAEQVERIYCTRSQIEFCAQLPTDCSAKRKNGYVPSESVFPFAHPLEEKAHFMPVGNIFEWFLNKINFENE